MTQNSRTLTLLNFCCLIAVLNAVSAFSVAPIGFNPIGVIKPTNPVLCSSALKPLVSNSVPLSPVPSQTSYPSAENWKALVAPQIRTGSELSPPVRAIQSFEEVIKTAESLALRYGSEKVLLVFDMDNTLVVPDGRDHKLGSDEWFEWQLKQVQQKGPHAIASSITELVAKLNALYKHLRSKATEEFIPDEVRKLQNKGHPAMVLTARDQASAAGTLEELMHTQYNFEQSGPKWPSGEKKAQVPPLPQGTDVARFQPALYDQGVYLTSGGAKGPILRGFLEATGLEPRAIIFVDDKHKNAESVREAFEGLPIEVQSFEYARLHAAVKEFHERSKDPEIKVWEILTEKYPDILEAGKQK